MDQCRPAGAVVTVVNLDADLHGTDSIEAICTNFCHQVYFFGSKAEADGWAKGRNHVVILTVDEGFELGKQAFSSLLRYAHGEP